MSDQKKTMDPKDFNFRKFAEEMGKKEGPISMKEMPPFKMDCRGLTVYAEGKGVSVPELSDEEKLMFITRKS